MYVLYISSCVKDIIYNFTLCHNAFLTLLKLFKFTFEDKVIYLWDEMHTLHYFDCFNTSTPFKTIVLKNMNLYREGSIYWTEPRGCPYSIQYMLTFRDWTVIIKKSKIF